MTTKRATKEWTAMFYFASDNPLAPNIVSQLKAIKDAGFHRDANVIAQFDPHTTNTPSHIFEINLINKLKNGNRSNVGFAANDPYVRNLVSDKLWEEDDIIDKIKENLNTSQNGERRDQGKKKIEYNPPKPPSKLSDEQTPKDGLAGFLDFCREFYPARHYLLFILGHGIVIGNDLFLFDEHAPKRSLLLTDLGEVLRKFKSDIGEDDERGELQLISFHSCSISALEVAFELKGTANYMLASQGPAFVGSWPYRQILIRVLNELNAPLFTASDLIKEVDAQGAVDRGDAAATRLVAKLKEGKDPVSTFLRGKFNNATSTLLDQYNGSQPPDPVLLRALFNDINALLDDPELYHAEWVQQVELSAETKQLGKRHPRGTDLLWFNRMLLRDAYPSEIARRTKSIKEMLKKIFYYCLYNSYDFQLAGYSFDLALCDLNRVHEIQSKFDKLSQALIEALGDVKEVDLAEDSLPRKLILLAHWDAQSYWQENYTDLYDFCFCLHKRCGEAKPASDETRAKLESLKGDCAEVMTVLVRGTEDNDDKLIVRSEFAGPLYQYSHGLSIFFPWSAPVGSQLWDEQYEQYKLAKRTSWKKFLETYFEQTQRATQADERRIDEFEPRSSTTPQPDIDRDLLELFQKISNRVFNVSGQLNSGNSQKAAGTLDKYGPDDPMGGSCDCPSIKNYPSITSARSKDKPEDGLKPRDGKVPISEHFFDRFRIS